MAKLGDQIQERLQKALAGAELDMTDPSAIQRLTPDEYRLLLLTAVITLCEEVVLLGYEIDAIHASSD